MSSLISNINNSKLKIRWQEPYVSVALNKQFAARESGILFGFKPVPGGGLAIDLQTNTLTGTSAMAVRDQSDGLSVLYVESATVVIDMTSFAGTKVWIGVSVAYAQGAATTGQIRAYTAGEVAAGLTDVDIICSVNVPAVGNIVADDIGYSERAFYWMERFESDDFHLQNGVTNNSTPLDTLLYSNGQNPDTSGTDINVTLETVAGSQTPHALRFDHAVGTASEARTIAMVEALEDDFVFVMYRVKFVAATAAIVGISVVWRNESMATISTNTTFVAASALTVDWAIKKVSFVAPAGSCYAEVRVTVGSMTAGDIYFEKFFVTTPKSGGLHDTLPALLTQSFLVAGFYAPASPSADLGLVRYDSSGYFGIEAISSFAQVKSDTGVKIITTAGDIDISPFGSVLMSGGYGSTGLTVSNAGNLSMNGNLVVDGQATFGGGYGSTGATIATTGNISTNGTLTVDSQVVAGTLAVGGGYGATGLSADGSGNLSLNGSATIDGDANCATKGTYKWFGGFPIRQSGIWDGTSGGWSTASDGVTNNSGSTVFLRFPLPDLPFGATITEVGMIGQFHDMGGSSETLYIYLIEVTTYGSPVTVSSEVASGASFIDGDLVALRILNTNGTTGDEVRTSALKQYYVQVSAYGPVGTWEVNGVYIDWTMPKLNRTGH